jgi:DNA-binding transcriptional ArsR family regulator
MSAVPSQRRPAAEPVAGFRALSEPFRLAIVDELRAGPLRCRDLRERLRLSAPLLSHHLRVLEKAGLVRCRRAGRTVEVMLDPEGLERLRAAISGPDGGPDEAAPHRAPGGGRTPGRRPAL